MMKRFIAALLLAPLAGGAAAFLAGFLTVLLIDRHSFKEGMTSSSGLAFWSAIICLAYTLVIGTIAFIYARVSKKTPTLAVALIVAFLTGVVPFAILSFTDQGTSLAGALAFPTLAAIAAVATAWTFWRVAFGRVAAA
jgi:hypothetical protein